MDMAYVAAFLGGLLVFFAHLPTTVFDTFQRIEGRLARGNGHSPADRSHHQQHEREVTHQRQRHAGLLGDLADRHAAVAVQREQPLGRQQDGLAPFATRGDGRHLLRLHAPIESAPPDLVHAYKP